MQWYSKTRNKIILLAPTLIFYLIYMIVPVLLAIGYSFTRYAGVGKPVLNGFKNYTRAFSDPYFALAIKNTGILLLVSFVMLVCGSFFVAILLNQKLRLATASKALVFSPAIIASIIVGILWGYILDPSTGLINNLLHAMNLDMLCQTWIGAKHWGIYSISMVYVWQQCGFIATIYLAGLGTIPNEVLEAAEIDGASFWQKLVRITVPMLKRTVISVGVLVITGSLKVFEIVQQLTNGGPAHSSETLVTYSYSLTFGSREYGYGMTLATLTFLISFVIMMFYLYLTRDKESGGMV